MLRTPLCDVLGVEVPIICAPFGPWGQVDLAAAVCNAGALGSLGTALRSVPDLRRQWARMREMTYRPFAINHTMRPLDPEAFQATLHERPAAISFHIGDRATWCSEPMTPDPVDPAGLRPGPGPRGGLPRRGRHHRPGQ